MILQDLFESPQLCPECGGISFSDLILAEKKDACYYKVKASAKVWPSAYASGRLVQCRKKGAANYGKSKNEGVAEGLNEFAPPGSNNGGDDGFSEETLKRLAAQWYNNDEDPRVEQILTTAGWEIGQDEGYDDEPGVFVVQSGDVNGSSYISWPAHELKKGVAEGKVSGYKMYPNHDGTWYVEDENENVVLRNASEGEAQQAVWSGNQKLKQGVAEGNLIEFAPSPDFRDDDDRQAMPLLEFAEIIKLFLGSEYTMIDRKTPEQVSVKFDPKDRTSGHNGAVLYSIVGKKQNEYPTVNLQLIDYEQGPQVGRGRRAGTAILKTRANALKIADIIYNTMGLPPQDRRVEENFTDDVDNIYAMHPQPEKSEQLVFLITDMTEDEFSNRWTDLPDPYQEEFGYDLPLWDADDLGSYQKIAVKPITFDQYVQLVGNYIKSEELAGSAMSKMKRGVTEGSSDNLRANVLDVLLTIYHGAVNDEDMTDTIDSELGEYFAAVEASNDAKLQKVYAFVRDLADADLDIQASGALKAMKKLMGPTYTPPPPSAAPNDTAVRDLAGNFAAAMASHGIKAHPDWKKKDKGVAEDPLQEFAPSGGEGNGPFDYGRAIVEIGHEFVDYYQDEGAQADAKAIIKVGQTFISAGMKSGIQAFYNLDTQIRDHVAEQLMEQGFNVKEDIYLPYKQQMATATANDAAELEKYKSSPEYAARRADDLTISAIPDKPINSWSKPGEPAASVTMDRASKRNIKAEFEKFKQDLALRDSLKNVPLRFEITVGGKPINIANLKEQGMAEDAALAEEFDLIESTVERLAKHNNVDAELIWEDLESLSDDELYVFAVTVPLTEDWQKANKRDRTDGMSRRAVKAYRREHPGSKLNTAVTTKPSKLKRGSKASKRRKSYCSRSRGQMKMHSISCAKTPDKAICKARRRWNCE